MLSKLLMGFFATIVVTIGGLVGFYVSGENHEVVLFGIVAVFVMLAVCAELGFQIRKLIVHLRAL